MQHQQQQYGVAPVPQYVDPVQECDEIGRRLSSEINRVSFERRTQWNQSVKVMASALKEGLSERVAIWEATRESFLQAFPEYNETAEG